MKLHIDGTASDDTMQGIDDFVNMRSGGMSVSAPFVVFDEDAQRNTDGPFDHVWQALAARAFREYLMRAHAQFERFNEVSK